MADVVYFDGGISIPFCPPTVNGIYISGSGCCSEFYSAFIGGNQTYNLTYTLPTASGTSGQVLTNDGNGNLSWTTVSGGGGTVSGNYVPYLGATGNTNLGGYGIAGSYFQLSTSTGGTLVPGMFSWNGTDGTADLMLKGGSVTLQIGQEQVARVINETGANLLESQYKVVRVNGSTGTRLKVALALASGDATSVETLGVVTENITLNQEGFITTSGLVRGINTTGSLQGETWSDGDMLFLSPYVAGGLTNIKPQAPNHLVVMGYVVTAANNGVIYVKVDNGYELDELHNVLISSAATNEILAYDGVTGVWRNRTASSLNLASGSGTTNRLLKWSSATGVTDSIILETGSTIDITGALRVTASSGTSTTLMGRDGNGYVSGITVGSGLSLSGNTLSTTGTTGVSGSGTATQVAFWGGISGSTSTALTSSTGLTWDNVNGRLGVNISNPTANLHVRGGDVSGTSSSLILQSTTTIWLDVRNDGRFLFTPNATIEPSSSAGLLRFKGNGTRYYDFGMSESVSIASGTHSFLVNTKGCNPTSGSLVFNAYLYQGTINQTGGASGTTRGLYVNPTLTSAFDWRSIEWSNNSGYGLYGAGTANNYLGGNTSIGVVSPSARLHVVGLGNTSTSTSFLVQNSSSNNMFSVLDNGNIGINTNNPQQTLHIEGTMRLTGSTGDSTTIMGRNASGDVSAISIGSGLSLSGNILSSTGGGGGSGTVTGSGTATQVAFWSGATGTTSNTLTSSTGLTWDNTNRRLGVGITSPIATLHVDGTVAVGVTSLGGGARMRVAQGISTVDFLVENSIYFPGKDLLMWSTTASGDSGNAYTFADINTGTLYKQIKCSSVRISSSASGSLGSLITSLGNAYFSNSTSIGTTVSSARLHVVGSGITTGTTLLLQNSGSTNTFAVLDNGQIGVNTATPNTSSIFQIDSTTLGFLPPRMSTTQKTGIASPAQGLVVYDTTMQALSAYNGSNWATVGGGEQMFTITGSTATINFNAGNIADITLATSTTLTLTGGTFGTFIIKLTQDATGGRVVSWPSNVRWSGGIPPSLTTTGGKVDVISLIFDGTNYYGTYALNF